MEGQEPKRDRDLVIDNLEARLRAMKVAVRLFGEKYYRMKKLYLKEKQRAMAYRQTIQEMKDGQAQKTKTETET